MIKNKCKKVVSAMLLMTMIATTFSVDVFAGGEFSCCTNNINCDCKEVIQYCHENCCPCISPTPQPDPTPKPEENKGANCITPHGPQPEENRVVTDTIFPPAPQSEPPKSDVVIDTIAPPTNIISTEVTKVDNSIQAIEEIVKLPKPDPIPVPQPEPHKSDIENKVVIDTIAPPTNIISTEVTKVDNSIQACEEVAKIDSFTQTYKKDITLQQIPESCKCGDNVRYTFNIQSGELTISGIGKMDNYSGWPDFSIVPPWESYKERIKSIKIENGVTKIGKGAFYNCTNLVSVTIPDSVTKICSFAFSGCTGLLSVDIPESVDSIGDSAFYKCKSLKNITILGSLDFIDHHAFYGCKNLDSVIYYGNRQPEIGLYRHRSLYPVFEKCSNLNRIHVPCDYKEDTFCGIQVVKRNI